jgi:hypothetical protein
MVDIALLSTSAGLVTIQIGAILSIDGRQSAAKYVFLIAAGFFLFAIANCFRWFS